LSESYKKKDECRRVKTERVAMFQKLLEMGKKYKRVNQYV
jgi:hypothetical protein